MPPPDAIPGNGRVGKTEHVLISGQHTETRRNPLQSAMPSTEMSVRERTTTTVKPHATPRNASAIRPETRFSPSVAEVHRLRFAEIVGCRSVPPPRQHAPDRQPCRSPLACALSRGPLRSLVAGLVAGRHNRVVRAILLLAVTMAWVACVAGGAFLTVYLVVVAFQALASGGRPASVAPPRGVVLTLGVYSAVMAALAGVLAALVFRGQGSGLGASALRWAAMPLWSAVVAATAALVLGRRRQSAG